MDFTENRKDGLSRKKSETISVFRCADFLKPKFVLVVLLVALLVNHLNNTFHNPTLQEHTLRPSTTFNLDRYNFSKSAIGGVQWMEGDGQTFGKLRASIDCIQVTLQFITLKECWTIRVTAKNEATSRVPTNHHLLIHLLSPDVLQLIRQSSNQSKLLLSGWNELVRNYSVSFDTLTKYTTLMFTPSNDRPDYSSRIGSNAQIKFKIGESFDLEVAFSAGNSKEIKADEFLELYAMTAKDFEEKLEKSYGLKLQNWPEVYQAMAKSALTNVLSSVKYSYGSVKAKSHLNHKFIMENIELMAISHSQALHSTKIDDQVFSILSILPFESTTALQIITTWLNPMNVADEVPTELFATKLPYIRTRLDYTVSPAPTIFYVIDRMLRTQGVEVFTSIYPKLEAFAKKMIITHTSFERNLFAWTANTTFLHDYPRHSGTKQANLDLHCWMVVASRVMRKLSVLGSDQEFFELWNNEIDNQEFLFKNFYNEDKNEFADTYVHRPYIMQTRDFLSNATGLVSILPLVFEFLPSDSPQLKRMLETINNPEELFSDFGVRSISKAHRSYTAEESDVSYQSDISIPANYLLLGALKHYSEDPSDNQAMAEVVYSKLRNTILSNVAHEFNRTKYLWESYSGTTGRGKGMPGHNWSALILNIMAENF